MQIRELGDFSVTCQVSGLLTEVNRIIDKRRELRARTMDVLHAAGIEIVSPNFMNTRAFDATRSFIPELDEAAAKAAIQEIAALETKSARLVALIDRKEAKISQE